VEARCPGLTHQRRENGHKRRPGLALTPFSDGTSIAASGCALGQLLMPSLIALGSVAAQDLRPEEIYQCLLPSVVTLQVEGPAGEHYIGTGFLALTNDTW